MSRLGGGLAALAAALSLAACGIETEGADTERQEFVEQRAVEQQELREFEERAAELPPLRSGEVRVVGETPGSLTADAAVEFNAASTGFEVVYEADGTAAAFDALCSGTADVVEVTRAMTEEELGACESNGVELAAPLQTGSDAIVVATRNESDVGGDCLGVPDLADIFGAGSTIDNWAQFGFDDLALDATGPEEGSALFDFFASRVLANTGDGVRSDYRAQTSDIAIKNQIINRPQERAAERRARAYADALRARREGRRQLRITRAEERADERALAEIERINRRNRRLDIEVDEEELERENAIMVEREKAEARERAAARFDRAVDRRIAIRRDELLERALNHGTVGFVAFSFYELFEEQLRPLEIDRAAEPPPAPLIPDPASPAVDEAVFVAPVTEAPAETEQPDCIFPSQETITSGQYPLSRRTLLYVPTRSLERDEVERFLAAYLADADELALGAGLVPIPEQLRAEQFSIVTGRPLQAAEPPPETGASIPGEPAPEEAAEPVESVPGVAD